MVVRPKTGSLAQWLGKEVPAKKSKKVKGTDILHVLSSNRCGEYDLNLYINDAAVVTVIGLDNTRIIQLLSLLFMYARVIKLDLIVLVS